ncbi:MAG: TauD/TfdA family dioxygenase [Rhodoferax sp.]|nr:TauD/TfdA family dioxygenase [Rhodoferax sp.]MCP5263941.1 TauD/TfdA family dioxygenase [Rhodoferax sp.]MCW5630375.1 TauD/TfdA family dioxygenase [Rhodoferax sp.]
MSRIAFAAARPSGTQALAVDYSDGSQATYSLMWLLDSCPEGFHPQTGERAFDLLSVPDAPLLHAAHILADGRLELQWEHEGPASHFTAEWLSAHRHGVPRPDAAMVAHRYWKAADLSDGAPRHEASAILHDDAALMAWLVDTKRFGLTIVHGIEGKGEASMAIARRIGFLRETNFGQTFEVVNKADPNNLAYTSLALALHTDLANQETPPGYQFLHCITNDAQGGGSVFADGFAMAQVLRDSDPQAFDVLAGTLIPCRFFDRDCDIRIHKPVITLDHAGAIQEIRFNAHLVDLIDLPLETVDAWYRAYRAFMRLTRDPAFRLGFRMAPGEMAAFDNRRILHGREAFNPATGSRQLHGCYVDRVEYDSRMRMLKRH